MPETELDRDVQAVRRFSRFYTKRLGILQERLLGSDYSYESYMNLHIASSRRRKRLAMTSGWMLDI